MTTITIDKPAASIEDDQSVINQLPHTALLSLGKLEGSGYHLIKHERDLHFSNGVVTYKVGNPDVTVRLG